MIRSMTGFGAAEGEVGGSRVSVEIRAVNHRFFNPSVKLPSELARWEADVRETLRKAIARGHVTLTARVERNETGAAHIDEPRFADYVTQLRALQSRFGLSQELDVGTVLRLPNVISAKEEGDEGTPQQFMAIVGDALAALDGMRTAEGQRLLSYLEERLNLIEACVERIAARAPQRLVEQRERLREAVCEL